VNEVNQERLILKTSGRFVFVMMDEIDWMKAEGNYVRIYRGKERYLIRDTLASMETRLDKSRFVRINRSVIVNIERIRELKSFRPYGIKVVLENEKCWNWGRRYRSNLDDLMRRFRSS